MSIDPHSFLIYCFLIIWPWKCKVNVMDEGTVPSHKVDPTSYQVTCLSYHVNQSPLPATRPFQKLTFKIQGQSHSSEERKGFNLLPTHIPFHVNRHSHSWYTAFSKFDRENHRYRPRAGSKFKVTKWVRFSIAFPSLTILFLRYG